MRSFDLLLRRKGYLTKRQVEILQDIARKHTVPLPPIPPISHQTGNSHTKRQASALLEQIRIPELESRQNARWLALLVDTEGAMGWLRWVTRSDRINERYRYEYVLRTLYVSVGLDELESKETVDEAGRLMGTAVHTVKWREKKNRLTRAQGGRAISTMRYMKPYQVKFRRLSNLCLTLFIYHTFIPINKFDKVIETLFGRYMGAKDVNPILLQMTEPEFKSFLRRAEELTDCYLK